MKKIFITLVAIAALAACTKSEVAYDAPQEIGFVAVAGNMTKAVVTGTTFPTGLNMYVFAETATNTTEEADYFSNQEFKYKAATNSKDSRPVWSGITSQYWPNVTKLHFAGYSKSGNFDGTGTAPTVTYECGNNSDVMTITGYTPGVANNDLMWFPSTYFGKNEGYGKSDVYVPVNMYHTCAWITFLVQGDQVTGNSGSTYKITSMNIAQIDQTADVTCTGSSTIQASSIVWSNNENVSGNPAVKTDSRGDFIKSGGVGIASTVAVDGENVTYTPLNIETGETATTSGNIVVIPQIPGVLELTYTYNSPAGKQVTDTYSVANSNALSLAIGGDNKWEPGKHYVYTITVKASEILISPSIPVDWAAGGTGSGVTVQ